MSEPVLRPVRVEDDAALHRLNREAFGYDFDPHRTRERLEYILTQPTNRLLAAELDGAVVGYVHAADYDCTYQEPLKNILAIAVDERCRGKGVGRLLMQGMEQWARETGCAGVRLVSGYNRPGAHRFYKAMGYTHRKDQKNFVRLFDAGYQLP